MEKKLADWVGTSKMVCLNSQTAAAETSLRVLEIGDGDEVITCAYTYTASASVAIHVGAKVVLVDCSMNSDSLEMDYDALEAAITEKTKVIVPVDNHREEHWIIVHGIGKIQLADQIKDVKSGDSFFIPKGCKHRLTNTDKNEC